MKKLTLLVLFGCFIALPILSFAQYNWRKSQGYNNFPKLMGSTTYNEKVTCIDVDGTGVVYVGTNEQGVYRLNSSTWTNFGSQITTLPTILGTGLTTCGPRFPPVQAIVTDASNRVYITFNGVNDPGTLQTVLGNNLPTGVYRYSSGTWSAFNTGLPPSDDDKTPDFYNGLATAMDFVFVSVNEQIYFRYIGTGVSPWCASTTWCLLNLSGLPPYLPNSDVINNLTTRWTVVGPPSKYDLIIGTTSGIYTFNLGACNSSNFNASGSVTNLNFKIGITDPLADHMNALQISFDPSLHEYSHVLYAIGGTNSTNPPNKGDIQLGSVYRYTTVTSEKTDGDWQVLDDNLPATAPYTSEYNINAKLLTWKNNLGAYRTLVSYKKPGLDGLVIARTTNYGINWSLPYSTIPSAPITCFAHQRLNTINTYVYAGTINQGVWILQTSDFKIGDSDFTQEPQVLVSVSPNPFDQSTSFELTIPFDEKISVFLYNVSGVLVSKIVDGGAYNAGVYNIVYNSSSLTNGVYYYQVVGNKTSITGKMIKN